MASFCIHLAIGKRYLSKHKINDKFAFLNGTIDPDFTPNKNITHYSEILPINDLEKHFNSKVNLYNFLLNNSIDNDYMKGYFLHLVTDYIFFYNFLDRDYIKRTSYKHYFQNLYYSYDLSNNYLISKYNIKSSLILNKLKKGYKEYKCPSDDLENILNQKKLDNFIEYVSSINLEKYRKQILISKQNIMPK